MTADEGNVADWREYDIHSNNEFRGGLSLFDSPKDDFMTEEFSVGRVRLRLRLQTDYNHSTGLALWAGAQRLAEYLEQNSSIIHQKRVLELGAGVGLPGLVAHRLGASHVHLTDGDAKVLENLRQNVGINKLQDTADVKVSQLIWGKQPTQQQNQLLMQQYDVILASDLFYMTISVAPLFQAARALLHQDGILIAVNLCASQDSIQVVLRIALNEGFNGTFRGDDVYYFTRRTNRL